MSKLTRKKKREEEKRIIAQMEEALAKNHNEEFVSLNEEHAPQKERTPREYRLPMGDATPEKIHCKRCKTLMENGVCPTCGYKIYVPMDEKKRNKIRLILAGVLMAAFVIVFVVLQIRG